MCDIDAFVMKDGKEEKILEKEGIEFIKLPLPKSDDDENNN